MLKMMGNNLIKYYNLMNINDFKIRKELSYETPSVSMLDVMSEGMLCQSFGEANEAGKRLEEDTNSTWDF